MVRSSHVPIMTLLSIQRGAPLIPLSAPSQDARLVGKERERGRGRGMKGERQVGRLVGSGSASERKDGNVCHFGVQHPLTNTLPSSISYHVLVTINVPENCGALMPSECFFNAFYSLYKTSKKKYG